ncbi:MAG TPA: hypothetical protein PKX16_01390 [Kiritimatiellia bacterium]|nr:hypothetical protein [Kiritimatiellia bacterium]
MKAAGIKIYGPENEVSWWDKTKAFLSGAWEGTKEGATLVADDYTLGLIDPLHEAAENLKSKGGWDIAFADKLGGLSSGSMYTALGVRALSKLGVAWKGTRLAQTAASKYARLATFIGSVAAKDQLDAYVERNPGINPYAIKALSMASQTAGYVATYTGMGMLGRGIAAVAGRIPVASRGISAKAFDYLTKAVGLTKKIGADYKAAQTVLEKSFTKSGRLSVSGLTQVALRGLDRGIKILAAKSSIPGRLALDTTWKLLAKATPAKLKPLARKVFDATPSTAALGRAFLGLLNFTGGTITALPRTGKHISTLKTNLRLLKSANSRIASAAAANTTPPYDAFRHAAKATGKIKSSVYGLAQSAMVGLGLAQVTVRDELRARRAYAEADKHIREGTPYQLPMDQKRGPLHMAWIIARSSFGNPFERPNRPNQQAHAAAIGAYRAGYDAIKAEGKKEGWTQAKTQQELDSYARQAMPWGMQGKEIWTWGTAAAAVGNWKLGELLAKARRSSTEKTTLAYDADTVFTERHPTGFRFVGMNAPETAKPDKGLPAEYLGPESEARIRQLLPRGGYFRAVRDSSATTPVFDERGRRVTPTSPRPEMFYDATGKVISHYQTPDGKWHPKKNTQNNGFDKYWRPLAQIEKPLIPGTGRLLNVPILRHLVPYRNVGETILREGLADIHYRHMKGGGDEMERYDAARESARKKGIGVWTPEARAALPWVGKEKTLEERKIDRYRRMTGQEWSEPGTYALQKALGLGFMTSGNTGILRSMPLTGGNIVAPAWNTALAILGAVNYNYRAERAMPRYAVLPSRTTVKPDWARNLQAEGYSIPDLSGSNRPRYTAADRRLIETFRSSWAPPQ